MAVADAVVLVVEQVGRLVESDLVLNLNEPSKIAFTSWIKPGKTTFPWWNGYYEGTSTRGRSEP